MSNVAIVTDTNSGISPEEGKSLGVHVIPMPVIIDGRDYLEHVNITHAELYQAILDGHDVSTSQPSPESLITLWTDLLAGGYDSIV
ncbi:MAG: DegV family protein, partial [Eubacterium sp.]|nr:DegV family protein [Eubacterium sp.]